MADDTIDVVVEIPRGSRNKYEHDDAGRLRLDRRLVGPIGFPGDYGCVPHTTGPDGDAVDALVLLSEPTFPGVVIGARPIGVFWLSVSGQPEPKLICVATGDPAWEDTRDLAELPPYMIGAIRQFFDTYQELEPGSNPSVDSYAGAAEAWQALSRAQHNAGSDQ